MDTWIIDEIAIEDDGIVLGTMHCYKCNFKSRLMCYTLSGEMETLRKHIENELKQKDCRECSKTMKDKP